MPLSIVIPAYNEPFALRHQPYKIRPPDLGSGLPFERLAKNKEKIGLKKAGMNIKTF
jgi:hypothetical protein